jgi:putative membrane protein
MSLRRGGFNPREVVMKKCLSLSAAVLAATFSFAPFVGAQSVQNRAQQAQDRAQQQANQAREQAGQSAREASGQAQQAAEEVQGQKNPDHHFIKEAAADNQYEIQLGQFMEQHAQNQQVKQLAQKLAQDHQRAQQQLEQAAKEMNMQVPTQLEQWQQAKLQMCEQMAQKHPGEMVDSNFAFGQVGDHRTDLLKYQFAAEHSQNAQLKQYAQQTIPVLEEHLRLAEQAAEQWVPQARTAGEHLRGQTNGAGQSGQGTR